MFVCTAINHCLADGIGSSQFLHAWAHFTTKPHSHLSVAPFHSRSLLCPRVPPRITFPHPEFTKTTPQHSPLFDLTQFTTTLSQPLVPTSTTFTPSLILRLKRHCVPSLKCTSFEALASHVWRAWIKTLNPPPHLRIKLLFSINIRKRLKPKLPQGFYGNGFVLGCAESTVKELVDANLRFGVKLVQEAKESLDDEYIRSMVDLMEETRPSPDLSASLVISQWSKLGLDELDFGEGGPLHMGPVASEIYCLFLPVIGDPDATRVLMSVPESVVHEFEYYMNDLDLFDRDEREDEGMEIV
ncbi:omega-hydroxypalmitate O-feruloyl transferase-like protein [Cinnamomum micranthum f. kanehirae]|uniref:Omega-hydroxypalmitate O-feruloyl transferase-like protein n=1 Tax=Cinnamomum micranthum f. kanehirae TaxID=337451 RepID=A0A443P2Z6_9MAGN|nr:omega-hydroxypalmitate O-feruloyl transferase-like protein [Cinnamomum micranthum f. kanehirae]